MAARGYITYSGRYTIHEDKVRHHVEISLFPNWIGRIQERLFVFEGDELVGAEYAAAASPGQDPDSTVAVEARGFTKWPTKDQFPRKGDEMGDRLKGKVAIVTGAGASGPGMGNGKATAIVYAREGASVVAVDIVEDAVSETKALIDAEGGSCSISVADVSDSDSVRKLVESCIHDHGQIDVLHNNVGIAEVGGPVESSEESWDRIVQVNLKSMFLTCKHALPHMERAGGGVIVNISSVAGIRWAGVPYIAYASTKAAIIQFTKVVAVQYAPKGIRCNCVVPGLINTPLVHNALAEFYAEGDIPKMIDMRDRQVPLGKMGEPWDVAHAALFLASDEAKYITGTELVVDGGLSCTTSEPKR